MSINCHIKVERINFTLDVELSLASTGITGVTGPSGSGKTTLLRTIAGLEKNSGSYLKAGDCVWHDGDHSVPAHQRKIGYVFQEASLFSHLAVEDNINYGLSRTPENQRKIPIDHAIDLLGIGSLLKRKTWQLSGGENSGWLLLEHLLLVPRFFLWMNPYQH